jgi:hypothetical protein
MIRVVMIAIAIMVVSTESHADVCFADAYGVRRQHPGAWPSWTYQMIGWKDRKCWFPATQVDKKYRARGEVVSLSPHKTSVVGSNPAAPTIAPLPRPREWCDIMCQAFRDFQRVQQWDKDRRD